MIPIKRVIVFACCLILLVGAAGATSTTMPEWLGGTSVEEVTEVEPVVIETVSDSTESEETAAENDVSDTPATQVYLIQTAAEESDAESDVGSNDDLVAVYSLVDPVTSSDTNGLKAIILELIGDYESIVVEYEYENSNGYASYVREIYPDYTWLCSCAIFLIMLYCTFRLGAAILCKQ